MHVKSFQICISSKDKTAYIYMQIEVSHNGALVDLVCNFKF